MKTAYISEKAYPELKSWLMNEGYSLIELPEWDRPYPAISSHPDIYMCKAGSKLIKAKRNEIGNKYPNYLGYNGIFLNNYFIHNLKYSSPALLREAERMGLTLINVNQGYTKCSCVVVDGRSIITADTGIVNSLQGFDIDVLKIEEGHVALDGFDYGFIGGASGRVGNNIVFNGDLNIHPNCAEIREFITNRGMKVVDFRNCTLYDIGTIFT